MELAWSNIFMFFDERSVLIQVSSENYFKTASGLYISL